MTVPVAWLIHLVCIYMIINQGYSQGGGCCIQCNTSATVVTRNTWTAISTLRYLNPFSYPSNATCDFNLSPQNPLDILRIKTSTFDLEESTGCQEEYIEILTENYAHTPGKRISLGRWCGQSYAKVVDIKGAVKIRYKAGSNTSRDFSIEVIAQARSFYQKELTETILVGQVPMYIYSLGYPSSYLQNLKMTWHLQAKDRSQQVNVEAVEFSLEGPGDTDRCQFDNLTLTADTGAHTTAVWCGAAGQRFFSGKNHVRVSFRTDWSKESTGFLLRVYTTYAQNTNCNGSRIRVLPAHHTAELLSLTDMYNNSMACSWIIQAQTQNEVIVLEIVSWDEDVLSCADNPFQIFDGSDDKGNQLVTSCGSARPFGFIRTSENSAYISSSLKVLSHNKIREGFRIKYYSTYKYDYEEYHKEAVTARSFVWIPSMTTDVQRPVINIRADVVGRCIHIEAQDKWRHQITMSFTEFVDVFDGTQDGARLIGVCSIHDHPAISGTGSTLKIKVKTPVRDDGFWLVIDTTQNCNGDTEIITVTNTVQRLTFPTTRMKLNNNFPSNTNCKWRLRTNGNRGLTYLEVYDLLLSMTTCDENYLMASSDNDQTQEIKTWCNTQHGNVTSLGDIFLMVAVNNFRSERKFTAKFWRESGYTCEDRKLSASTQWNYLTSPGFPANYPNNANCSWVISSRLTTDNIKLEFIQINTHSCDHDVINVYEGTSTSQLRGKMCGSGYATSTLQSFGSSLYITFTTDSTITDTGFKLAYYSVHPSGETPDVVRIPASEDIATLNSPDYPLSYPRNMRRFWVITASSDDVVTVQRSTTYGSSKRQCRNRHDTLAVYDGVSETNTLLGYFCHIDLPVDAHMVFQSSGQFLYLSLFSSDSIVESGYAGTFSVTYFSGQAQRACLPGEMESLRTQAYWQYLKYPVRGEYPRHAHCAWKLWTDNPNSTIVVEVTVSDLEESYSCKYDAVRVFDGYSTLSPETGVFCGKQTPTFYSSGRYLFLLFVSDDLNQGSGFTLRYRVKPDVEEPDAEKKKSDGLLIGATTAGVFLLIVTITCFFCFLGKLRRKPPQSRQSAPPSHTDPPAYSRSNSTVYVVSPIFVGATNPTASDPPPYPGLTNPAYSSSLDDLPPSYPGIEHAQPLSPQFHAPPRGNEHMYDDVFSDVPSNLPAPPPYAVTDTIPQESPPEYETVVSQAPQKETDLGKYSGTQMHQQARSRSDQGEHGRGSSSSPRSHPLTYELLGPV
ncbi:cubilin-like [Haliotis cracherodii]|uniref:cubilin-like n=1 Tax=Haliotis cracherodii TaxID=6455 RepID=UPI0039EAB5F4